MHNKNNAELIYTDKRTPSGMYSIPQELCAPVIMLCIVGVS